MLLSDYVTTLRPKGEATSEPPVMLGFVGYPAFLGCNRNRLDSLVRIQLFDAADETRSASSQQSIIRNSEKTAES